VAVSDDGQVDGGCDDDDDDGRCQRLNGSSQLWARLESVASRIWPSRR
jgi:hypothetical protein